MKKTAGREVLFMHADESVRRNGEGTFIRLKNGDIMFAFSRFAGETWHDDCAADIAAIFSSDEGETWSDPTVLIHHDDESRNLMCPSLLRMHNGDIGLVFLRKSSKSINAVPYIVRSSDEGQTFSAPLRIIEDKLNYYVAENDHIIMLESGRIILPVNLHSAEINGVYEIIEKGIKCVFASDDDGYTWYELAGRQETPFPEKSETGLQETCIYQQKDGVLRALSRTDLGTQYECFSYDDGATWTSPQPERFFSSPDSPLLMKRVGKYTVAVFNPIPNYTTRSCDNTWGRTPLVCAVSKDDGKTFFAVHMLESDPENGYCYPAIFDGGDYVLISYYHSDNTGVPLTSTRIKKMTYEELGNWFVAFGKGFVPSQKSKNVAVTEVGSIADHSTGKWLVPAVYRCGKGFVVDFCIGVESSRVSEFVEKWRFSDFDESKLGAEEIRAMSRENPFENDGRISLVADGKEIKHTFGSSLCWIPPHLMVDGYENSETAELIASHYELDKSYAWILKRESFEFSSRRKVKSLKAVVKFPPESFYGDKFSDLSAGDSFEVLHPLTDVKYTVTVKSLENTDLDKNIKFKDMIIPTHYSVMTFDIQPYIAPDKFRLVDTSENDKPMPCAENLSASDTGESCAVAVIGGADGPVAVFCSSATTNEHSARSALKHRPAESIDWQVVFREKTISDFEVELF